MGRGARGGEAWPAWGHAGKYISGVCSPPCRGALALPNMPDPISQYLAALECQIFWGYSAEFLDEKWSNKGVAGRRLV